MFVWCWGSGTVLVGAILGWVLTSLVACFFVSLPHDTWVYFGVCWTPAHHNNTAQHNTTQRNTTQHQPDNSNNNNNTKRNMDCSRAVISRDELFSIRHWDFPLFHDMQYCIVALERHLCAHTIPHRDCAVVLHTQLLQTPIKEKNRHFIYNQPTHVSYFVMIIIHRHHRPPHPHPHTHPHPHHHHIIIGPFLLPLISFLEIDLCRLSLDLWRLLWYCFGYCNWCCLFVTTWWHRMSIGPMMVTCLHGEWCSIRR